MYRSSLCTKIWDATSKVWLISPGCKNEFANSHSLLIAIKEINLKATAMTILEAGLSK